MRLGTRWRHVIGALLLAGVAVGCGGGVTDPMSPQQARAQVMDAGKELVWDLGLRGNLVETVFSYESCTDDNKGPFRGKLVMVFWMPGAAAPVDPATLVTALQQHGWQGDPDSHSHSSATLTKNDVDAYVDVVEAYPPPVGHASIDLYGQCRDTYDHSKDPFDRGDVTAELESQ
ncbi:putative lipoprotein [Mycolicibacterium fortuitum]|uniref:Putative lipoprotein n=1 Tax=Mycolicibacterium fortuitum TaxID=1766 RepID=A0A378UZV5_MYCFO|nr:putative lipoprotein [Mycolicibacterium fortuitum]